MIQPAQSEGPTTLARLAEMFRVAMEGLGRPVDASALERWAVVIHSSMSGRGRSYHTVEHVFTVNPGNDAIGSLAILFHDTVYCEVDGGLPRGLEAVLGDALHVDRDHVELRAFDPSRDVLRALVARIFGFEPGQPVTFQSGLNELASALLAVRSLESHLDLRTLAEVVTCIEATIPFRPQEAEDLLAERLAEADREHALGLGPDGVERAVRRAVEVANRDIGNFAYDDPAAFLSHTWEILPETNPTLRMPAYTLREYRSAMSKMEGFLSSLEASRIFRVFRGTPSGPELEAMLGRVRTNLRRGTRYLRQKVLAARLLESLAQLTGGDAPVSLFMGDLPFEADSRRLEDLLGELPTFGEDVDEAVFRLLSEGRKKDSGFDLRHSPLAAYLYAHLGGERTDRALEAADGWPLLTRLPQSVVVDVARATAEIASTRADALRALADQLEAGNAPA
ncbi:MAG: hypothetical protein KF729_30975 [Sandaracinaceae bacterium]|nr:hypothetical protein [Sandaracinaceae bacterium]